MLKTLKNEKGFTFISTLAGALMVLLSLGGLVITMISAQKQMFERYYSRCAMLNASNYYHIVRYQIKKKTLDPSLVSSMRIHNTIGRYHIEVGDTELSSDPRSMEDEDRYAKIDGHTTFKIERQNESIPGFNQAEKYYVLTVGTRWELENFSSDDSDSDDPGVSKPESVFYVKGLVY